MSALGPNDKPLWKHGLPAGDMPALIVLSDALAPAFDCLLAEQDRLIALAYHQFRRLGVQVSKALRTDDVDFYTGLLRECADFLRPRDVKHLWRVVRRSPT